MGGDTPVMAVCVVGMALVLIMKVLTPSAHHQGPCPMSSSPAYTVVDQFDEDEFPDVPAAPAALLAALRTVPDPRQRQGLRHELDGILTLVACAVVAGSRSFVAIAEWAEAATPYELGRLGILGDVPSESTIRRTLKRLDADGLDVILGAWAALYHVADPQQMQVIALDGKTLRGARGPDGRGRHLLGALSHDTTIVLGQLDVNGKTNEIPMLSKLLDTMNILGTLITADALHTQTAHATVGGGPEIGVRGHLVDDGEVPGQGLQGEGDEVQV